MENYLRLIRFLRGHVVLFSVAVITMLLASVFEVVSFTLIIPFLDNILTAKKITFGHELPDFLNNIINYINSLDLTVELRMKLLLSLIAVFVIMTLVKNLLIFVHQLLMSDVSQRVMKEIRSKLYTKIQNLSLDYFSKKRTGELISRITNDVSFIENALSYGLTDLCKQTFMIIFWTIMAIVTMPDAAIIILVIFPIVGYPLGQIGKKLKKISAGQQEEVANINSLLLETISGVKLVKAFNTEKYEIQRFEGLNHSLYKWWMKSVRRLILISPVTEIIGTALGCALIVWKGSEIISGQLSFGVFTMFFASFMNIIRPAKKLGNVNAITQRALAASDRIYDVLNQEPTVKEKEDALTVVEMKDALCLESVDFQYDEESGIVLKDINLVVKKGELVAIVGPTGTGKSTLVNLLPRFYDPTRGRVTIDGINLKDVSFSSLRNQFGIVSQDTVLFNDTVRGNITYGQGEMPIERVEEVATHAYAHRFIKEMPQGYETIVGDRGFRLSGGEKQRLSIARAILRNPPILILDEATSQLDSESEKFVQEALDELMEGRTVIAIAHRLSTILKADKIVVLNEGRIVGIGRHDKLLVECELYRRLYSMQFAGE